LPDGFSPPFPLNTIIDEYDASVVYTDYIFSRIIEKLSKTGREVYIIFASDHGQHVSLSGCGHGNLERESHYEASFFMYKVKGDIEEEVKEFLGQGEWTSHYDISRITAFYLGYKSLSRRTSSKRTVYVNGPELNGNSGYMEILLDEKGIKKRITHY